MINKNSYSDDHTIKYYKQLGNNGIFNYEKRVVEEFFVAPGRVLDVGCGTGRTTEALWHMKYDVVGVDYSSKMIDVARSINRQIDYQVQDARNMTFSDCTFDYALFSFNGIMLIESYEDRRKAMNEIYRVLKPNGLFFFTTPYLDNKINKQYWAEKVRKTGKSLALLNDDERIEIGNDIVEDSGCLFQIHVPFVSEVERMIRDSNFLIVRKGRRLDYFEEEAVEDELDDNYIWVVRK